MSNFFWKIKEDYICKVKLVKDKETILKNHKIVQINSIIQYNILNYIAELNLLFLPNLLQNENVRI